MHALFAKPFCTEFTRKRGRIITSICDRDRLIIGDNGSMIILLRVKPRHSWRGYKRELRSNSIGCLLLLDVLSNVVVMCHKSSIMYA